MRGYWRNKVIKRRIKTVEIIEILKWACGIIKRRNTRN